MQSEREVYSLNVNAAIVLRGPVVELQALLDEVRRFVETHPGMHLVFRDVSGDPLRIQRERGRP